MKRWLARIGAALGILLVLLVVYGVFVEPRLILDEERAEVPLPELAEADAGTEVAVVADWQVGAWFDNDGMVEHAVDTILAADPDVVLLGGDFVYSKGPGGAAPGRPGHGAGGAAGRVRRPHVRGAG